MDVRFSGSKRLPASETSPAVAPSLLTRIRRPSDRKLLPDGGGDDSAALRTASAFIRVGRKLGIRCGRLEIWNEIKSQIDRMQRGPENSFVGNRHEPHQL